MKLGALKFQVQHYRERMLPGKALQQLSIEERTLTQPQLEFGIRPKAIAKNLDRSTSALSRESKRMGSTEDST